MALGAENITEYFTVVCLALEETHHLGRLHRNLSSSHVFCTTFSWGGVKMMLGGHANLQLAEAREQEMLFAGEEYYLAPEVAEHHKPYTAESDRWALGMFLRELISLETAEFS